VPRRRSATKHELTEHVKKLYQSMYATSRRVPSGHVLTYGQLAELSGLPGGARVAGAALKVSSRYADKPVPWQRIVGKAGKTRGRIAIHDPVGAAIQRQLLEAEGVIIGDTGLIDLGEYGWLPSAAKPRTRTRAGSGRGASPRRRPRSGSKRRASSSRR
jgi:methylated-DNA-protein-cysteine methyltransferase related protein